MRKYKIQILAGQKYGMSNNDLLYSRLADLNSRANELSIDFEIMREAFLVLKDQAQRQTVCYAEGCGIPKDIIEKLRPLCYMGVKDIDSLVEATEMLIEDPDGVIESLRYLGYLEGD